jgi:pimeloyl-ACP methyl ester carboxylesterase
MMQMFNKSRRGIHMSTKTIIRILFSAAVLSLSLALVHAQEETGKYAAVNGLQMYYEVHGEGEPLVLLHGGLGGIVEFSQLLPLLAESRQVIAVELQGHGHTADIDRPLSYEQLADDVAALIQTLGYENADIMGYSLGGGVALQTAIRHPAVVRKLVLVSTPFSSSGIHDEFRAGMAAMSAESASAMLETPMYQFYSSVAPRVEDWSTMVGKIGDMMRQDYDWSEDVANMTTPTLIVVGDSDMLSPAHAVELFELLGGGVAGGFAQPSTSELAVLPATNHFTILSQTDLLLPLVTSFLDFAPAQNGE